MWVYGQPRARASAILAAPIKSIIFQIVRLRCKVNASGSFFLALQTTKIAFRWNVLFTFAIQTLAPYRLIVNRFAMATGYARLRVPTKVLHFGFDDSQACRWSPQNLKAPVAKVK